MSRHEISAFDTSHKIIVGWDDPVCTFFIQVIDRKKEHAGSDDKFVYWVGTGRGQIDNIDELARHALPYAELTPKIRRTLYRDKDERR